MISDFNIFSAYFTGASQNKTVVQKPPYIITRSGESVASGIKCEHKIQFYEVILWYKQDERKALKLLGYLNLGNPYLEDMANGKFSFDGDGRSHSSLNISNPSLNDSAVYFCAASRHSAARSSRVGAKTLIHAQVPHTCSQTPSKQASRIICRCTLCEVISKMCDFLMVKTGGRFFCFC